MTGHDHHGHSHDHDHSVTSVTSAFFVAIAVNAAFSAIEAYYGFSIHSLALISDAGHNVMDVLNLVLS